MVQAVDRAYVAIRTGIMDGSFAVGAHLRAEPLAERLGVSRTPVREALRRLDAEGLVNLVANHGAYVRGWSRRDMEEVFDLRIRLESYAAELGAHSMPDSDIAKLEELDRRMREAASSPAAGKRDEVKDLNTQFHRVIIEGSMSRRLGLLLSTIVEAHLITRTFHTYTSADIERSMNHHSELIAAIRARDPEWASAIMQSHLRAARQVTLGAMPGFADDEHRPSRKVQAVRARSTTSGDRPA